MPVASITTRQGKGSPLTAADGDQNFTRLRDAINALEQLFLTVLNPNGTLKDGAVGSTDVLADGIVTAAKLAADAKLPSGMMVGYGGGTLPDGWLLCDGSSVSRTTYADLFAAIGETHGAGDGVTTFTLPDSRGRSLMGAGTGPGLSNRVLGDTLGAEEVTLTVAQLPSHSHGIDERLDQGADGAGGEAWTGVSTGATDNTGGDEPHENIHPVLVATMMIKT